jgi:anti-anti-sigma regulatory factor
MAASHPTTIVVDASALAPDAVTIDGLARLQLAARRLGRHVQLRGVSEDLMELIAFVGLEDVLRREPSRKAEEGEQPLGVEEERELDDPAA